MSIDEHPWVKVAGGLRFRISDAPEKMFPSESKLCFKWCSVDRMGYYFFIFVCLELETQILVELISCSSRSWVITLGNQWQFWRLLLFTVISPDDFQCVQKEVYEDAII